MKQVVKQVARRVVYGPETNPSGDFQEAVDLYRDIVYEMDQVALEVEVENSDTLVRNQGTSLDTRYTGRSTFDDGCEAWDRAQEAVYYLTEQRGSGDWMEDIPFDVTHRYNKRIDTRYVALTAEDYGKDLSADYRLRFKGKPSIDAVDGATDILSED